MCSDFTNKEFLALARSDFPTFAGRVFIELNPGGKFKSNWHHRAIGKALNDIERSLERRLIINSCPRSLKSTIVSVAWPAYLLGHDPTLQIMCVSHNMALAVQLAHQFRKIVNSSWYREAFPHMAGKPDTDNETIFRTSQGGVRVALSVGSGVTGLGADIILLDDPIDAADANNPDACETTNQWIAKTLMTRLNDKTTGRVVLVMQRVSIHDTTAFLMGKEKWNLLSLPAKTDVDREISLFDGDVHLWKQGELLHPEFLPDAELQSQKVYLGEPGFQAQYLQRPTPNGGGRIDLSLFGRFEQRPKAYDHTIMSIDAASGMQSGSRTSIQIWTYSDGGLFLRAAGVGYWTFPDTLETIVWAKREFGVDRILVENESSGRALLETLYEKYPTYDFFDLLHAINPRHSKVDRMAKAMLMVQQGRVHLPNKAEWLPDFEQEILGFPEAKLDDQVDAMSQAINWVQNLEANQPQARVTLIHRR